MTHPRPSTAAKLRQARRLLRHIGETLRDCYDCTSTTSDGDEDERHIEGAEDWDFVCWHCAGVVILKEGRKR